MTEPTPPRHDKIYNEGMRTLDNLDATYPDVVLEPEWEAMTDELMKWYFERKRDRAIAELRALDRLLGLKQTIPRRVR